MSAHKNSSVTDLSVILPTYNEAGSIVSLLSAISRAIDCTNLTYEIIVVDDSSPDGTAMIVQREQEACSQIRLIIRKTNPSLGLSILEGIQHSRGNIILGMDADFNHNPDDILKLIQQLKNADCVVASRFLPGGGMLQWWRGIPTYCFNVLLRLMFDFPCTDNTSGFYSVKRKVLFSLPIESIYYGYGDYHLRLVYLLHQNGYCIAEIPTYYGTRIAGRSKSRLFAMAVSYAKVAWKLRFT